MSALSGRPVLFANHTAEIAGAEVSLLELLDGLSGAVERLVACPRGPLRDAVIARGIGCEVVPGTTASARAHPLQTSKGIAQIAHTGIRLRALARRFDTALLHANTERAGLAALLARRIGGPPTIVHARGQLPPGWLARATRSAIEAGADAIVANSAATAAQFAKASERGSLEVVYDPIDSSRFNPDTIDRTEARARVGLAADEVALAVVGYLAPLKAQDDAIRVLAKLKPDHPQLRLLIVGSPKFTSPGARLDHGAYADQLRVLARELSVERDVRFLGEREDIPELLRAADLVLVPSWHEGFGRVVLEAMAMRLPVVATSEGGPAEIVRDGIDGMLLAPRQPERWAETVAQLLARPDLASTLGERGRERVLDRFTISKHASRMLGIYNELIDTHS